MSKKAPPASYYPVFLNIEGKKCVVVGGGQVAFRKVKTLLENGADVDVISPEVCPELVALTEVRIHRKRYQAGDLEGVFLAVIATDDRDTNHRAAGDARSSGVLVNVVDDAENSDFILPSLVRRGDVTIAISTAGRSPALARRLRTRLEGEFGEEYTVLVRVIDGVRRDLKQRGIAVDSETWQEALDLDSLAGLVREGRVEKAGAVLRERLMRYKEVRQV